MALDHTGYLTLLEEIDGSLERLSELARTKTTAVQNDDLDSLNDCMKREQALSLQLRSCEQKRAAALKALNLDGVPLSGLAAQYPEDLRRRAGTVAEKLRCQYAIYRSASDTARTILECNLHQIEEFLAAADANTGGDFSGPGYAPTEPVAPPAQVLHTDIRT